MKSVYWEPSCSRRKDGQTDERTEMTKLIVAFRNFANVPKKSKAVFGIIKFEPVK